MSPELELLMRIRTAGDTGGAVETEDLLALARAIDRAIAGEPLESALGLGFGWRGNARDRLRTMAFGQSSPENGRGFPAREVRGSAPGPISDLAEAKHFHTSLGRYFEARFDRDLTGRLKPIGDDRILYDIIVAEGGKVPSVRTLRRRISALREVGLQGRGFGQSHGRASRSGKRKPETEGAPG